jgi:hypothetical protein
VVIQFIAVVDALPAGAGVGVTITASSSRSLAKCLHSFEGECWRCQLVNLAINGLWASFTP